MEGFIAHLDYNMFSRSVDLQFAISRKGIDMPKMIALPLGEGTLLDAMDRVDQVDMMFAGHQSNIRYIGSRDEYRQTFSSMLQLLLYCEIKPTAKLLVADYVFKKGAYVANIRNWLSFFNEIRDELLTDIELIKLMESHLTESCWPDNELRTLTTDVVFYISRFYSRKSKTTYLSEIIEALKSLGGKGHLNDICRVMKERGKLQSILTNPAWTNAVSREIQSHSTDAQSYVEGNDDLFYSVEGIGGGVWGLRNYQPNQEEQWWPTEDEYSPGLTTEAWLALLKDHDVFNDTALIIVRCFKDYGGAATCAQLAAKYGRDPSFYNMGSQRLAERIVGKTGCPTMPRDSVNSRWWPVIYLGKSASTDVQGVYM